MIKTEHKYERVKDKKTETFFLGCKSHTQRENDNVIVEIKIL